MSKLSKTVLLCLACGLVAAPTAHAEQLRFTYDVEGDLTIPVPASVTSLDVRLTGGAGADGTTGDGGRGALITGRLAVTPGTPLTLRVDGGGARGAQAAGAGGHMAAILAGGTYLVAAGGGGGAGGGADGGDGGDAGAAGGNGTSAQGNAGGGAAGTISAGGAGGALYGGGANGSAGAANVGGAGGASSTAAGGGGGGGVFGGGGGGSASSATDGAGGGGGGASLVDPAKLLDATQALASDTDASVWIAYDDTVGPQLTLAPIALNPTTLSGVAGTDFGDATSVKLKLSDGQTLTAPVGAGGAYSVALPALPDGDYTVTATQADVVGNTSTTSRAFTVDTTPLILDITLGGTPSFATFQPGVARDYTATATASVTSTADTASFSVVDSSPNHPGHLVNGAFALAAPLQMQAASAAGTSTGAGALSGTPRTLLDYARPVGSDAVTLTFTQPIGSRDVLRSGNYAKTLTYTLATTTP